MLPVQTIYKSLPEGKSLLYGWFGAMHTRIDLILCDVEEEKGKGLVNEMQQQVEHITHIVNRFDEESELSLINRNGYKQEMGLSTILFHFLTYCVKAWEFTSGCFDITIQSGENYVEGIKGIYLNPNAQTIQLKDSRIQLDLSGIAKGYALDICCELLQKEGIKDMFISFGNSSIAGWGTHPCGTGWIVSGRENSSLPPITLQNEYLTISGNESPDRTHLIDPKTKSYIKGKQEIAVKTKKGIIGEVLSTAYFVADPEIREWLEKRHSKEATFYS